MGSRWNPQVDWDTFTPAPCRFFVMPLTGVLGFFFTSLTMFLSSTAVVFLGRPVWCLLLSTPAVSFFFRTSCCTSYQASKWLAFVTKTALWSSCWFIFLNTNAVFTGKTQELVSPINQTGHIWATRNTRQLHDPKLFLTKNKINKIKSEIRICYLIYIFWPQTQLSWVYRKNKGPYLTVIILLEVTICLCLITYMSMTM